MNAPSIFLLQLQHTKQVSWKVLPSAFRNGPLIGLWHKSHILENLLSKQPLQ